MPFPDRLIALEERVVADVRPHGVSFGIPVAWLIGFGTASFATGVTFDVPTPVTQVLALTGIGGACLIAAYGVWRWATRAFVVTGLRVISRSGLVGRRCKELPLGHVAEVEFYQSIVQARLNAGRLVLRPDSDDLPTIKTRVREADSVHRLVCESVLAATAPSGILDISGEQVSATGLDVPGLIGRLAALREQGIVTDEEFEVKKAELLRRL